MTAAARYARQVVLPEVGEAGQAALARSRVLMVGLGGLGCPAALYLAAGGVGTLVLNDFDRVDETNLPRQTLFGPDDVGALKIEAARRRLTALVPGVRIECVPERLDASGLDAAVRGADVVLDGSDNFATRLAVNRACVAVGKALVSGAAVRLEGQIGVFPNRPGGPCYRCVYDEEDEWLGSCQGNGVLGPVPGVIGTLMAVEAMKWLAGGRLAREGANHDRLTIWDAATGEWRTVKLRPNPACPECAGRR